MKLTKLLKKRKSRTFKVLNEKFKKRSKELFEEFKEKHKETSEWLEEKGVDLEKLAKKTSRGALAGLAAGTIMFVGGLNTSTSSANQRIVEETSKNKIFGDFVGRSVIEQTLSLSLKGELPQKGPLDKETEEKIINIVSQSTGLKVTAELDGNRINTNFGLIGLEQHLPRYPGETLSEHFSSNAGSMTYSKSGMTRNKGAFGYFARDKFSLDQEGIEREKYYVVVQTSLSSGWGKKPGLVDWYKFRKVLVINPENGRVVVGDIADSGPALSTGKNFGGSPELMDQLGLFRSTTKGKVLLFFIDETGGSPPLGPL